MSAGLDPVAGSAPDLPVAVALPDPLGREVRAWVESELGWQLVPPGGPPRPALTLRAEADGSPDCLVVVDGAVSAAVVRRALQAGAVDVLGWPDDRDRLTGIAGGRPRAAGRQGPPLLRVGGAGGGVGTSTVALAVAGLLAWSGRRVIAAGEGLAVLCGLGPWDGPGVAEITALGDQDAAPEVAGLARPVPGVDGLGLLGGAAGGLLDAPGWPVDAVVVDAGAGPEDVSLVVAAPDARLARVARISAPVLLVGAGPLDRPAARAALGRAPIGWLPASRRVARAAVRGRVPAGLPGSWLRELRAALAAMPETDR